jgi:2-polyprenyl-6-methoxyphenol hydroxylase-like FAD-dependent oxidoreductase
VRYEFNGDIFDVRCRLVVGADGRQSTVRRGLGIELRQEDSKATLGGMLVRCDWPDVMSFIGSEGDCYYLGFPRRDAIRVYLACEPSPATSGPDRAKHMLESFRLDSLPDSDRIADGEVAGPCSFYIGSDAWTERPVADGVVLVGDAAGWSDPIIGNGLSVAMRDARSVAEVLLAGDDWSIDAFEPYAVERAERMRRLKIAGHVTTVNRCTFTDAGRTQRDAYRGQMMTDPLILGLVLTSVIGPETCPAEAFTDENIDRVLNLA